eukprot:352195-Chlamydomonas_euryale.AAC.3
MAYSGSICGAAGAGVGGVGGVDGSSGVGVGGSAVGGGVCRNGKGGPTKPERSSWIPHGKPLAVETSVSAPHARHPALRCCNMLLQRRPAGTASQRHRTCAAVPQRTGFRDIRVEKPQQGFDNRNRVLTTATVVRSVGDCSAGSRCRGPWRSRQSKLKREGRQ